MNMSRFKNSKSKIKRKIHTLTIFVIYQYKRISFLTNTT